MSLEVARGFAALAVAAHHGAQASDAFTTKSHFHFLEYGALGVDFFFVLSGFIIYFVHERDNRSFGSGMVFIGKRLRRIYVPFIPISVAMVCGYLLFPQVSLSSRDWSILTSLTLIPTGSPPALSVAWTLIFELMFYLFFFFVFFQTRFFWLATIGWAALVMLLSIGGLETDPQRPSADIVFDLLVLEFIAGMLAARAFLSCPSYLFPYFIAFGILMMASLFIVGDFHRVLFGISLAPLVLGVAQAERSLGLHFPRFGVFLGVSSYSIYLIHTPVQSIVARGLREFDSWIVTFFACLTVSVIAGVVYHVLYERPALRVFVIRSAGRL